MKIALLDYLSPIGHVSLINFYIKKIGSEFDQIILNQKVKKNICKNKKIKYLNFDKGIFHKITKLYLLFKKLKNKKISKVLLLSYEPKVLFILSFFIDLKYFNLYLLEHDNLSKKKFSKLFFIKNLSKKFIYFTYSLPAKKFLINELKKKVYFIDHPIIEKDKPELNKTKLKKINKYKTILIPTRHHLDEYSIRKTINKYKKINFIILLKKSNFVKKLFFEYKNVIRLENISEKDISKVGAIYLPLSDSMYGLRVSAWLYRGIAFHKKVILNRNSLYKFEKKRFPNHITASNFNFNKILNLKINKKKNKRFIDGYNSNHVSNLKKLLIK